MVSKNLKKASICPVADVWAGKLGLEVDASCCTEPKRKGFDADEQRARGQRSKEDPGKISLSARVPAV